MAKLAIVGAGSWGSALAALLLENGHSLKLWSRDPEELLRLQGISTQPTKATYTVLHGDIVFTTDLESIFEADTEGVIIAVASQAVRQVLTIMPQQLNPKLIFVNVSKGIENGSLLPISKVVESIYPDHAFAALSGPSHAEEVSAKLPTTLVSASYDRTVAEWVQDLFTTPYLRVYTNPDVIGVELGGALKNIIALGAGISDGMGFGDNAKAALITRGIKEIARLGIAMGAKAATFEGLTGIGDLIVTCTSMHSRNRRCGIMIGEGMSLEEAISEIGMVVEGAYTAKAAYELSVKYNVSAPITKELYRVLYEGFDPRKAVPGLMQRDKKHEMEENADLGSWDQI
jgi:glycerol-3-phosphate dehydrogenase (NAD(P)+)